jgi:hypothetical protein
MMGEGDAFFPIFQYSNIPSLHLFSLPGEPGCEIQVVLEDPHFLQEFRPTTRGYEPLWGLRRHRRAARHTIRELTPNIRPDIQGVLDDTARHSSKVGQLDLWRDRFGHGLGLFAVELDQSDTLIHASRFAKTVPIVESTDEVTNPACNGTYARSPSSNKGLRLLRVAQIMTTGPTCVPYRIAARKGKPCLRLSSGRMALSTGLSVTGPGITM